MKFIVFTAFLSLVALPAQAVRALRSCTTAQAKVLSESVKLRERSNHVYHLTNSTGKIYGIFITDHGMNAYAEICDYNTNPDYTTASSWFFWESKTKANPTIWKRDAKLEISQDDGRAVIRVLNAELGGNVKVEFTVFGWDENSREVSLMKDTLKFNSI
jgi:hypothetical protein